MIPSKDVSKATRKLSTGRRICMLAAALLTVRLLAGCAAAPREVPGPRATEAVVADFESGLADWHTNDAVKHSGKTQDTRLISIALSDVAHSGKKGLEVCFHPGKGWANAYLGAQETGEQWAAMGADELSLWLKGYGSAKQVTIGFQAWTDDLSPTFFGMEVPLKDTEWHQVVIPFSKLQESNPKHPLRLRALISFQVNGSGEMGPARLWLDDVVVRSAHGEGARFATGPLDGKVAAFPPVRSLPRLGMWGLPKLDPPSLAQCKVLGLGFGSNGGGSLLQQRAFFEGIATNHAPGRPSADVLLAGLGLTDEDMDQDAQGRHTGEGVESSIFHPEAGDRFCRYIAERVRARKDAPWVASFMLSSPISRYGEVHYAPSLGGQYAVFSRPAKENFRGWLKQQYGGDLAALARAWGRPLKTWEDVLPPAGPKAGPEGLDARTCWSDFMHWYNWWLEEVTRRSLAAARRETGKPLAVMMGGPKVGPSQGISLGNIGPTVRLLGHVRPAFLNDTDSQTLFSCRYTRAACSQYGVDLMVENVGPPYLEVFHQYNMLLNVLACGADFAHLAGAVCDAKTWFGRTWAGLAPLLHRYQTGYTKSDAAIFHSYMTSWYRAGRSNVDALRLYDATNTLWYPDKGYPSWGRALASPDVVDDAMIEDGALRGRKLLVIPNSSVTVTSRKAVEAIREWVQSGGTVVGFGPGCLAYTVEPDRQVRATPGMAGLSAYGQKNRMVSAEVVEKKLKAARDGSTPAFVDQRLGKGRAVLYMPPADPDHDVTFTQQAIPILAAEADRAQVRRFCRADADYQANLIYCGRDRKSGKHLFVADLTRCVRNGLPDAIFWTEQTFNFSFDPSLTGDAELVGITDSFERCEGGNAEFDAAAHTLVVRFRLPGSLALTFGKGRSGLAMARHPLLIWSKDELILRPASGWGQKQTQEPIRVGADGSLQPADARIISLVHGARRRAEFGRGPTFRLSLARPGALVVHVNSVARGVPQGPPAGATLVISLDGKQALCRDLPDKDGKDYSSDDEYDQDFAIDVPAGEHEVRVDNQGEDWFSVDHYVFRGLR